MAGALAVSLTATLSVTSHHRVDVACAAVTRPMLALTAVGRCCLARRPVPPRKPQRSALLTLRRSASNV